MKSNLRALVLATLFTGSFCIAQPAQPGAPAQPAAPAQPIAGQTAEATLFEE